MQLASIGFMASNRNLELHLICRHAVSVLPCRIRATAARTWLSCLMTPDLEGNHQRVCFDKLVLAQLYTMPRLVQLFSQALHPRLLVLQLESCERARPQSPAVQQTPTHGMRRVGAFM